MKLQIRKGCFETNSSSQHCIAIVKPEKITGSAADHYGWELTAEWLDKGENVKVNDEIVIDDDSLNFGRWPFRTLTTMYNKAQYAIASYGTKEKFEEISDICEKLTGHGLKTPLERYWRAFIVTGPEDGDEIPEENFIPEYEIEYDEEKDDFYREVDGERKYDVARDRFTRPYYGDIDHQSQGTLQDFLRRHDISLEEFLSNPQYVVIIDGDEYGAWPALFEAGICQKDTFIETGIYKYDHKENDDL